MAETSIVNSQKGSRPVPRGSTTTGEDSTMPFTAGIPQAGGHQDQVSRDSSQPGKIIKKTTRNELEFYETLVNQLEHPLLPSDQESWSEWRPQFFGSLDHDGTDERVSIILENLTFKRSNSLVDQPGVKEQLFKHPNVIDIKLGQRLYDNQATPEKQQRMIKASLETTSAKFGIRLTGAQIWDNVKGEYSSIPKSVGKLIKPDGSDLQIKFNTFFPISDEKQTHEGSPEELSYSAGGLPSELLKQIIDQSIIPQIRKILIYLSSFNWRIYGASLLIVFEAHLMTHNVILSSSPSHNFNHPDDLNAQDMATVKVIDFAHVQLADSPDPGLLKGIQSTLDLFNQLSLQLGSL
ncbi:uncharacterized protein VP01_1273g6 [Puccinia sorghi]|uniref:Kinase n=1 Tax=Puccinia sorghi TaxID=27349 RepID=A0A0L6VNW0_9BASI|nr:uncharacterized protein VP01_1273g6 [Puccinia sorghi]